MTLRTCLQHHDVTTEIWNYGVMAWWSACPGGQRTRRNQTAWGKRNLLQWSTARAFFFLQCARGVRGRGVMSLCSCGGVRGVKVLGDFAHARRASYPGRCAASRG
jgi:hypothetical protein